MKDNQKKVPMKRLYFSFINYQRRILTGWCSLVCALIMTTLFYGCVSDEDVTQPLAQDKISYINFYADNATRTGYANFEVKDNEVPAITPESDLHAYLFLKSSKGRKAWFEIDFNKSWSQERTLTVSASGRNLQLHWIDDKNISTTLLASDKDETWQLAAITGGGTLDQKTMQVNFDDDRKGLKANQIKKALFSKWSAVSIPADNSVVGSVAFEPLGVTLQVKIVSDEQTVGNDYLHNYELANNMISPNGYFDFSQESRLFNGGEQPAWVSKQDGKGYTFKYDPKTQDISPADHEDIFLVWGMPMKRSSSIGFLTINNPNKDLAVAKTNTDDGQTVENPVQDIYLVEEQDFFKDLSMPQRSGQTLFLNRTLTRMGGAVMANYPIPLARFSDYNVALDNRAFAVSHLTPYQGHFTFDDAQTKAPDGYHVPTIEEFTAAFPYNFNSDFLGREDKLTWENLREKSPREEIARLGNGKSQEGIDNDYIQQKFFASYYYKDGVVYGTRFVGYADSQDPWNNVFRCAYKYEFVNVGKSDNAFIKVTARYLGPSKTSILSANRLSSSEYWAIPVSSDVVRIFPLSGRYSPAAGAGNAEEGYVDRGAVGNYWTASDGAGLAGNWGYYIPLTYDGVYYVHSQEKGSQNAVRPVINARPKKTNLVVPDK